MLGTEACSVEEPTPIGIAIIHGSHVDVHSLEVALGPSVPVHESTKVFIWEPVDALKLGQELTLLVHQALRHRTAKLLQYVIDAFRTVNPVKRRMLKFLLELPGSKHCRAGGQLRACPCRA